MWDFAKNLVVDDINAVPENFRGLYAQDAADKKFKLSEFAKPLVEAYVGQTTALDKARKDLAAANGEAASRRVTKNSVVDFAKKLGLENVDEENPLTNLETYFTDLTAKVKGGGDLKINLDNIKKDYERKNGEIKAASDAEVLKMRGSLEKYMIGNATLTVLAKHGGNATLLSPLVKGAAKVVVDENGDYSVRIVDESGAPRSNGSGGWLDLDGYVGELKTKPEFAAAFASEAKGGSGAKQQQQQQQTRRSDGTKSSVDKIASGLATAERGRAAAAA
jgi:hypothetical protein